LSGAAISGQRAAAQWAHTSDRDSDQRVRKGAQWAIPLIGTAISGLRPAWEAYSTKPCWMA
jgi:hypothetical protein